MVWFGLVWGFFVYQSQKKHMSKLGEHRMDETQGSYKAVWKAIFVCDVSGLWTSYVVILEFY